MRFSTIVRDGDRVGAVRVEDRWVPFTELGAGSASDLYALIAGSPTRRQLDALHETARSVGADRTVAADDVEWAAPYPRPRKIWGIGLNYAEHAADLEADYPEQPASFIKADHTIIGYGDDIPLPTQSSRVTSEAELGLIIGRECRDVDEHDALEVLFGVCPILDQTAEDILQLNPRYLTRSKNFPGFFSFGPEIVTIDEVLNDSGTLDDVVVSTIRNGEVIRSQPVRNMRHGPEALVSFHSRMMPLFPGDVISTGTPGAAVIRDGDVMESHIEGLSVLRNPVRAAAGT